MTLLLAIACGGALGALLRYGLSGAVQQLAPGPFPWGTFTVNVLGSLLIGICWEALDRAAAPPALRGALIVGFLGAFTTFSTYSLETVLLARAGDLRMAGLYMLAGNAVCVCAALTGLAMTRFALDTLTR